MAGASFRKWFRSQRIAVLMGGPSAERSISLKTGHAILQSLERQGFNATAIDASPALPQDLRRKRITFAFIALHGPGGEDGAVQGMLEWMEIHYTGSGVLASAVAMDKAASRLVFASAGLPVAKGFSVARHDRRAAFRQARDLQFPLVVKPSAQGSAIGVSIVKSERAWAHALAVAFRYGDTVIVERYLQGPEITIGVLGEEPLPIIEIVPSDASFYDFEAKYAPGGSKHLLPARLKKSVALRSTEIALAACRALGTRGAARVDLIVDRRQGPTLLEVNTIPGMTETSLLPDAARAAGLSFDALVLRIAELFCV